LHCHSQSSSITLNTSHLQSQTETNDLNGGFWAAPQPLQRKCKVSASKYNPKASNYFHSTTPPLCQLRKRPSRNYKTGQDNQQYIAANRSYSPEYTRNLKSSGDYTYTPAMLCFSLPVCRLSVGSQRALLNCCRRRVDIMIGQFTEQESNVSKIWYFGYPY
jgi:hypothetical protein